MKMRKFLAVLSVMMIVVPVSKSSSALNSSDDDGKACQELVIGKWVDLKDSKSRRIITRSGQVIDAYKGFKSDTMSYFFLNDQCDTLCMVKESDTFVYHIAEVNDDYFDLTYLGLYNDEDSWVSRLVSYRKE